MSTPPPIDMKPTPLQLGPGTHRPPAHWPDKLSWLRSLGIGTYTIRLYGLDRPMSPDAWICSVKECLRLRTSLMLAHEEQKRLLLQVEKEGELYAYSRSGDE